MGSVDGAPRHAQRERILDAVLEEIAERGYNAATTSSVARRAGVTEADILSAIGGKKACFLAACARYAEGMVAAVSAPVAAAGTWRAALHAGVDAYLRFLTEHPTATRACLLEGAAAGPEAVAIRDAAMVAFAGYLDRLQSCMSSAVRPMSIVSEATVGGIYRAILTRVRSNQIASLPQLAPQITYALLAQIIGGDAAQREVAGGGMTLAPLPAS